MTDSDRHKRFHQWMIRVTALGGFLILAVTLFPFNFSIPVNLSLETIRTFNYSGNFIDQLVNILLFLPFSFGLTGLAQRAGLTRLQSLLIVLGISASLSIAVEVLQFFLPSRNPTVTDILTNSIGSILGYLGFYVARNTFADVPGFIETGKKRLTIRALALGFIIYFVVNALIAIELQANTNFSNWDGTFPLVLGNEPTGDRPWQGAIAEVTIINQAAAQAEVAKLLTGLSVDLQLSPLVAYQLAGQGNYRDRAGNLSDLFWQQPALPTPQPDTQFNANRWLQTSTAATLLTEKIRQTSEFTLAATFATANLNQTGPARIISLSQDSLLRNFTLGQQGNDLIFRLRTPISGTGGQYPQIIIPDVLVDDAPHHFVITYDHALLQFYLDKVQNSYSIYLSPEITLFRYLLPFNEWNLHLTTFEKAAYKLLYYSLVFVPLGILLGLIAARLTGGASFYLLLGLSGILLPSALLEGLIASQRGNVRLENVLLAIGILTITASALRVCLRRIVRKITAVCPY